jgi:hypothetical protein
MLSPPTEKKKRRGNGVEEREEAMDEMCGGKREK